MTVYNSVYPSAEKTRTDSGEFLRELGVKGHRNKTSMDERQFLPWNRKNFYFYYMIIFYSHTTCIEVRKHLLGATKGSTM